MMVIATLASPDILWTTIILVIWVVFIGISEIGAKKKS
jgi:hypothetical protein